MSHGVQVNLSSKPNDPAPECAIQQQRDGNTTRSRGDAGNGRGKRNVGGEDSAHESASATSGRGDGPAGNGAGDDSGSRSSQGRPHTPGQPRQGPAPLSNDEVGDERTPPSPLPRPQLLISAMSSHLVHAHPLSGQLTLPQLTPAHPPLPHTHRWFLLSFLQRAERLRLMEEAYAAEVVDALLRVRDKRGLKELSVQGADTRTRGKSGRIRGHSSTDKCDTERRVLRML